MSILARTGTKISAAGPSVLLNPEMLGYIENVTGCAQARMASILVVEDDPDFREALYNWLTSEHYNVEVEKDGGQALSKLRVREYDVIVLDWGLPTVAGAEICREFRNRGGTTPILMLTGRNSVSDKTTGLDYGADDYLTKPCNLNELSARIRALLRRSSGQVSNVLRVGDLLLNATTYSVSRHGEELSLQPREFALLEFLMRHPNTVFSPEALLDRVWASEADASPHAIRTCMMRLRKKLDVEGEESLIQTVHGVGYKLQIRTR